MLHNPKTTLKFRHTCIQTYAHNFTSKQEQLFPSLYGEKAIFDKKNKYKLSKHS